MSAVASVGAPGSSASAVGPGGTGGSSVSGMGASSSSGTGGDGGSSGPAAGGAGGAGASSGSTNTDGVAAPVPSSRTSVVAVASTAPGTRSPSGSPAASPGGATGSPRPVSDGIGAFSRPADSIGAVGAPTPTVPVFTPARTESPVNPTSSDTLRLFNPPETPAVGGNNTIVTSTAGSNGQGAETAAQLSTVAIVGIVAASVIGLSLFFTTIICCCLRRRRRRRRLRREKSQQLVDAPMSSQGADASLSAFAPSPISSTQPPTLQSIMTSPSLDLQSAPPPVYPGFAASPDDAWRMQQQQQQQQQHVYSAQDQSAPAYPAAAYGGQTVPYPQQGHHEVHGQDARFEAMGDTHLAHELHAHPCGTVVYELPCEQKC